MNNGAPPRRATPRTPRAAGRRARISTWPTAGRAGNLPRELTSFVGRDEHITRVSNALRTAGLVTLAGIGGVGKTRLALHTASAERANYAFGAWIVELAPLSDAARVIPTVAAALGVRERPGSTTLATLQQVLRGRQLLLMLDNCEHVLQSCAELAVALLQTCDDLTILATSREPLGVPGEAVYWVPCLPVPEGDEPLERLRERDAVRLLVARIQAVEPAFELTDATALHVSRICRLLDGLPLAIELAAARARTMNLAEIADRLSDPLRVLTVGPRTAPQRQQTLRATLDWSYGLLNETEQRLLRRLAVFSGGCTADAAEVVCGDASDGALHVVDVLEHLVNQSLLIADTRAEQTRFSMLETVRHYCLERLAQAGETARLCERHRDWCLSLVAGPPPEALDTTHVARLVPDLDNLRAALRWTSETGQVESAVRLGLGMSAVWHLQGSFSEGRAALSALLDMAAPDGLPAQIAYVGTWAGTMAGNQGDYDDAENLITRSLRAAEALGDERASLWAQTQLGGIALMRGDVARARTMLEHAYHASSGGNFDVHMISRYQLAVVSIELGDRDRAVDLLQNFDKDLQAGQQSFWVGRVQMAQAVLAEQADDLDSADRLLEQTVVAQRASDDQPGLLQSLTLRGAVALARGDRVGAAAVLSEALEIAALYGSKLRLTHLLEVLSNLALDTDPADSVRLAAAAEHLRTALGAAPLPTEQARIGGLLEAARHRLGEKTYAQLWLDASTETLESTLVIARGSLQVAGNPTARPQVATPGEPLSEREREVAALVASGLSNREIAEELVISLKTVEAHIHHVLNKLGLTNRVQIATWGLRHGIVTTDNGIAR